MRSGCSAGKRVQDGITTVASQDPTGLTSLLPGVEGFRYYSVVWSDPQVSPGRSTA